MNEHPRRGSALVIVLGLLSVLLLMGVAFSVTMRTERSGASNERHAVIARQILDTALDRAVSELDAALGENPVVGDMVVLCSDDENSDDVVNILSHDLSLHVAPDQLAAAARGAEPVWSPIYGATRVSRSDQNPTENDPPVGRYAYVVLNSTGYLNPSTVGLSNRWSGVSAAEIQPAWGDSKHEWGGIAPFTSEFVSDSADGSLSAVRWTRRTPSTAWENFKNARDKDGHYPNMGDFLCQTGRKRDGGAVISNKYFGAESPVFTTNFFYPYSFSMPDLRPSSGEDSNGNSICLPKIALNDIDPAKISAKDAREIQSAFDGAFEKTVDVKAIAAKYFPGQGNTGISWGALATRVLFDAIDDDYVPGYTGTGSPHQDDFDSAESEKDEHLSKLGLNSVRWSELPCTEPVPMLDTFIVVAGQLDKPYVKKSPIYGKDGGEGTEALSNKFTVAFSLYKQSTVFLGDLIPKNVDGVEFDWEWMAEGIEVSGLPKGVRARYEDEYIVTGKHLVKQRAGGSGRGTYRRSDDSDEGPKHRFKDFMTFEFTMPASEEPPENLTVEMEVHGHVNSPKGVVQWAPSPASPYPMFHVSIDVNVREALDEFDYSLSDTENGKDVLVLRSVFAVDPRFAYFADAWVSDSDDGSAEYPGGDFSELDGWIPEDWNDGLNPVMHAALMEPRKYYKKLNGALSGQYMISDEMWARKDEATKMTSRDAYKAGFSHYIEGPFTRAGELGFLPIGTLRTIALLDGFGKDGERVPRQKVLDYFVGSTNNFQKLNLNPPNTVAWPVEGSRLKFGPDDDPDTDGLNYGILAAALAGCPYQEWDTNNTARLSWKDAELLAKAFARNIKSHDDDDFPKGGDNYDGVVKDISVLGRCVEGTYSEASWDSLFLGGTYDTESLETKAPTDFEREGIIRNTSEMLTTRQQFFTILVKADAFTPKFGYSDASHGTSLASVSAVAEIWRDPEPMRDKEGKAVVDSSGNPIHPWVLLYLHQF